MAFSSNSLYPQHIVLTAKSAAEWTAQNPTLLQGELGIESDTQRIKIGNGSLNWANLNYIDANILNMISTINQRLDTLESLINQYEQLADALHSYFNSLADKTFREELKP